MASSPDAVEGRPPGTVYVAVTVRDQVTCRELHLVGGPEEVLESVDQLGSGSAAGENGGDLGRYWPEPRSRMRLIRRRLQRLPLQFPRLDGTTWPDRHVVGRTSFAARTLHQMGYREAFAPESHDIADLLLAHVLPLLPTGAAPEDEPYLRRVFSSAAQIGAGIGIVERRVRAAPGTGDRQRHRWRALGGCGRPSLHARPPAARCPVPVAVRLLPRAHRPHADPGCWCEALSRGRTGR